MNLMKAGTADRASAEAETRYQSQLERHVAELREMIAAEVSSRAEAERFIEASRQRERRLVKAVAALEGVPLSAGGKPPKVKPKAKPSVSAEIIATVLAALADHGRPMTAPQLATALGRNRSSIDSALRVLREQQKVRLAGKDPDSTAPIAPNLYALMPDA